MTHRLESRAGSTRSGALGRSLALLLSSWAPDGAFALGTDCPDRPAYSNLRYEEDWRYLADARCAVDHWDRAKYIPLAEGRSLSFGGDARIRYERFDNPGFGSGVPDDNGYLLQRYLAHGELWMTRDVRFFGQLESSLVNGRNGGPRPTDENRADVNQLFAEGTFRSEDSRITLRLGRQEVELGSAQFTSARDGLNDRLSFDGVRALGEWRDWRFHAMATRVVPTLPGAFDDRSTPAGTLSGFFLARNHALLPAGNAVVYASRRTRENTAYADGVGPEQRYTTGTRWWGRDEHWDYNLELGAQTGSHGADDIRAWYVNTDNGWNFREAQYQPRLGVRFSIGSGDRKLGDGKLGTFSPLFAATAYSGLSGQIGPSNSISIAPSVTLRLTPELQLTAGTSVFWRQSLTDGIYNIAGDILRQPGSSDARLVGAQPTLTFTWTPTRHVTVLTTLSYFRAGPFLRETPPGENVTYFTAWWAYRF